MFKRSFLPILSICLLSVSACDRSQYDANADGPNPPTPNLPSPASTQPSVPVGVDPATIEPPADPTVAEFVSLRGPKPATWIWHPPQNRMYTANWTVPGQPPHDAAHLVIFHFGPDMGGTPEDNIARWENQWRTADQGPVEPVITEMTADDMSVTMLQFEGEWMRVGTNWFTPGQAGLFAIVDSPSGYIFIRLAGDAPTVLTNRDAFVELIGGLERIETD